MGHLSYMGFENFRVFADQQILKFAPISILTGTNSSGKSSIFKAIKLLQQNFAASTSYFSVLPELEQLQELEFSGSTHKLGSFSQILNRKKREAGYLRFYLPFLWPGVSTSLKLGLTYIQDPSNSLDLGILKELEISDVDTGKTWVQMKSGEQGWQFYFDFVLFRQVAEYYARSEPAYPRKSSEVMEDVPIRNWGILDFQIGNRKELKEEQFHRRFFPDDPLFGYRDFPEQTDKSKTVEEWIGREMDLLSQFFKKSLYPHHSGDSLAVAFQKMLHSVQSASFLYKSSEDYESIILDAVQANRVQVMKNRLEAFWMEFITEGMQMGFRQLTQTIAGAAQLGSVRANVQRFYTNESQGTEFNSIIYQFLKAGFQEGDPETLFVDKWLKEFEIADGLHIERDIHGVGSRIYLENEGDRTLLADLGYGVTQFIPILFKIAVLARENYAERIGMFKPSILMVEEPETNLHPRFQSLLADLFFDAAQTFHIQFILETHSEYLIRKFQYLVSKKILTTHDIAIFYLRDPEKLDTNEKQVLDIKILPDGELSESFGKGFVDESARLIGEIWKVGNL